MPQSKFLVEFLQEKQEPFSLKDYLVERGYRNPSRISKISAIFGLKKRSRQAVVPHCSDVFKHVFSQILEVNSNKRIKNPGNAEHGRLSSETSTTTTMSISCSESDPEEDTNCQFAKEGAAKEMSKRTQVEDNKQLSPVSVLELTEPDNYGSPVHYKQCNYIQTQGTPDSRCELGKQNRVQELQQQLQVSDSYTQYIRNRKMLRQSRKLLTDCTREVIENHKKKDKRREHLNQILGTDQLWKLVCDNVWQWSQDLINETNTSLMVHSDVYAASEEWKDGPKQQMMEISIEIGDAILDEIIHAISLN